MAWLLTYRVAAVGFLMRSARPVRAVVTQCDPLRTWVPGWCASWPSKPCHALLRTRAVRRLVNKDSVISRECDTPSCSRVVVTASPGNELEGRERMRAMLLLMACASCLFVPECARGSGILSV